METQERQIWSLGLEDPWSRNQESTPVFLPGKFHGQRSQVGYNPWGHKEPDTTERLNTHIVITTTIYTCLFHPLKFTLDMVLTKKPVLPTTPPTPLAPYDETLFLTF